MTDRHMFVHKLSEIISSDFDAKDFVQRAKDAKLKGVWIKACDGLRRYSNLQPPMKSVTQEIVKGLADAGIETWGWHNPVCASPGDAAQEARNFLSAISDFGLAGGIADAEDGEIDPGFFVGTLEDAETYATTVHDGLSLAGKRFGVTSYDDPKVQGSIFFGLLSKFYDHADFIVPQVYYGQSSSVRSRLDRAIAANTGISATFVPAGAGWVGKPSEGACSNGPDCAKRAADFVPLVHAHSFDAYAFWLWDAAPAELWNFLESTAS